MPEYRDRDGVSAGLGPAVAGERVVPPPAAGDGRRVPHREPGHLDRGPQERLPPAGQPPHRHHQHPPHPQHLRCKLCQVDAC